MALTGLTLGAPLAAGPAQAETADQIEAALIASEPRLAQFLGKHPEIKKGWRESYWADALLRAPRYSGTRWRVHDMRRPQPPTLAQAALRCPPSPPPYGAVTIFDGSDVRNFAGAGLTHWRVSDGALESSGAFNNRIASRSAFGDVELHIEYRAPAEHVGNGQHRGNSGIFMMGLYEIQLLDSYDNPTYPDGAMGALYGQQPPLAIASLPPGRWQCIDIVFKAPRFTRTGTLMRPALATIRINGALVQDNSAFRGPTRFAALSTYRPHAPALPFTLQDHGDPGQVAFRNIWARPLNDSSHTPPSRGR